MASRSMLVCTVATHLGMFLFEIGPGGSHDGQEFVECRGALGGGGVAAKTSYSANGVASRGQCSYKGDVVEIEDYFSIDIARGTLISRTGRSISPGRAGASKPSVSRRPRRVIELTQRASSDEI